MKDCYKTIFYDICDFTTSWQGTYAQWIESCDDSSSATTTIIDKSWPSVSGQNVLGGTEDDGIGCF